MSEKTDETTHETTHAPAEAAKKLHCLVCDRELDWSGPFDGEGEAALVETSPSRGTVFVAYGNYGSTVFDPFNYPEATEVLRLTVCDDCLLERKERVLHVRYRPSRVEVKSARPWRGLDEE